MTQTLSPTTRGEPVRNLRAWTADDLTDDGWRVEIPRPALAELESAIQTLRQSPVQLEDLSPSQFDLAHCRNLMLRVKAILDEGSGFALLDRLPAERYSDDELTAAYWLLSSLLARPVAQSHAGARMYKVHDTGRLALPGSGVRPDQTGMEQNFHNDNSYNRTQPSYIGLLCVRPAKEGGESSVLSIASAHERLRQDHPDLLARLYEPFWVDRQKEHAVGDEPLIYEPVFKHEGRLKARIGLVPVYNGYAMRGETMDGRGAAALEALKAVFRRPELSFNFSMQSGQMQFVDNLGICHRRTAFTDEADAPRKRLLMRIWLRDEGGVDYEG